MQFQQTCTIPGPIDKVWEFLTDIPSVAKCLPGVEQVREEAPGKYVGIIALKVGIIKLRLSGEIQVESMDKEKRSAVMAVRAADARISGQIQGKMTMNLREISPAETELIAGTDVNLFGKIGEFGQPMIRKKADQMMAEFARNVATQVAAGSPT